MMIRINLLPVRAVKKREMGRQVLVVLGGVLLAALALNYLWYSSRESEMAKASARVAATSAKIAELEQVIGEVNNIKTRKAEVERKLGVLDNLRKGRAGPVRMMDALANAIPKKVWLTAFTETDGKVSVAGSALSHDEVAEFMRGLNNIVWTPKGMGRLVEQRREARASRVELLNEQGSVEEFPVTDIKPFFTGIDLLNTAQAAASAAGIATVSFNLSMTANYAI